MPEALLVLLAPKALREFLRKSVDVQACRDVHHYIVHHNRLSDSYVPNELIRAYSRSNCLADALSVFNHLVDPTVFSWSAIISAHAQHSLHEQAFDLYTKAHESNILLDGYVYTAVLRACVSETHLEHGKVVHGHILDSPCRLDVYVSNMLLDMYGRCGCLVAARQVFEGISERNIVSWNTLLSGYTQHKAWEDVLLLFGSLQAANHQPNQITFVCVLKACASLQDLNLCMRCHVLVVHHGMEFAEHVNNVLIDVYTKCSCLHDAECLFKRSPGQNVIAWTSIISGYVDHGCTEKAFAAYVSMQAGFLKPNDFTFSIILKACANERDLNLGMHVHTGIVEETSTKSTLVSNSLIGMYTVCGSLHDALQAFEMLEERDVVSWNSIIAACSGHGHAEFALHLFKQLQLEGFRPDILTLESVLRACSWLQNLHEGRITHLHMVAMKVPLTMHMNNNLLHMYLGCENVEEACKVFRSMLTHDAVTWNVMIAGCAKFGQGLQALRLFYEMVSSGVQANAVTLVALLKAFSITSALQGGRLLHMYVLRNDVNIDEYIGSCLISFYTKCGVFEDAQKVFSGLQERTVVPWSAMIESFVQQRNYREAFICLEKMNQESVKLDDVVYLLILSACSDVSILHDHALLWHILAGQQQPTLKHYNCLADLLGRAGHLSQAKTVLENMPFPANLSSWTSALRHNLMYSGSLVETLPIGIVCQQERSQFI